MNIKIVIVYVVTVAVVWQLNYLYFKYKSEQNSTEDIEMADRHRAASLVISPKENKEKIKKAKKINILTHQLNRTLQKQASKLQKENAMFLISEKINQMIDNRIFPVSNGIAPINKDNEPKEDEMEESIFTYLTQLMDDNSDQRMKILETDCKEETCTIILLDEKDRSLKDFVDTNIDQLKTVVVDAAPYVNHNFQQYGIKLKFSKERSLLSDTAEKRH